MKQIVSWSGGKDSTATIVLAHEHGIKIDEIIISLPWFDRNEKIYADHPDHVAWVLEYAKPLFESWGYPVKVLSDERDYIYWFYKTVTQSKFPERNGLYYGFLIAGRCKLNESKIAPIKKYIQSLEYPITMYEGIASDETDRLKSMHKNRNHLSLLEKYDVKEFETYDILRPYNLLSPIYKNRRRQGCWFCPSQNAAEAADFKLHYPYIWSRLKPLAEITSVGMTNAKCFRYNKTFDEFEKEVDEYIKCSPPIQLTIFDMMNGGKYEKSDTRRLMAEKALNTVSATDKNAFYAGENQYDKYCIDFYYMNNQNGRIYLCSCYIENDNANCIMRIFKEV